MIDVTIVLPVHNEEKMLPITLNSIYNIDASELIFLMDRCNDGSEKIIQRKAAHGKSITRIVPVGADEGEGWGFRCAFLRRKAYAMATHETIVNTSADIVLDPAIREHIKLIPKYGLISFGYLEKPWTIQQFQRRLINRISPITGFAGLLAVSKRAWMDSEDLEDLKKVKRGEDTHLNQAIKKKHPTLHINTRSLHLRPNESKTDQYYGGVAMWRYRKTPFWKAFLHSAFYLRPAIFTGWVHAHHWSDLM